MPRAKTRLDRRLLETTWLSAAEVAKRLGVSESTVLRRRRELQMPVRGQGTRKPGTGWS